MSIIKLSNESGRTKGEASASGGPIRVIP
jgi:hypothetical protein